MFLMQLTQGLDQLITQLMTQRHARRLSRDRLLQLEWKVV